jgi:pilus assembly protein CpaC
VLYIQGKKIGTTNLIAFDASMNVIGVMDIEVVPDTSIVRQRISASGGRGIRVSTSNGQIVLTGTAPSAIAADHAVQVAKGLAPQGAVINAMTVAPSQQVMLKVRFLEVTRQAGRDLGVNWFAGNNAGTRGGTTGNFASIAITPRPGLTGVSPQGDPASGVGIPVFQAVGTLLSGGAPFGVALANLVNSNGTSIDVLLSALEQKGLVRSLAEPNLVALSGDTAAFLAGGEFPYPSIQPGGSGGNLAVITTNFKPFGVQLTFSPTVLAHGIINLRLAPSVSELDFANSVIVGGTQVPSIIKREARTTIELRDGQSFAIAGLLASDNRRKIAQLPWVGTVPVLGTLFRSTSYQKNETDLVVIVTPHLVAPSQPGQHIATPLDKTVPSNDVDFFLLGEMEKRKNYTDYVTKGGGVQGPYGYILPVDVTSAHHAVYLKPPHLEK